MTSTIRSLAIVLLLATSAFAQVDTKVRPAPDFGADGVWLDQGAPVPHHISDYRGKVVLIDFWEYTCINCVRDFGVVKRWYTKYHQYGFDVVGVHFGEFNIGFDVNNVRDAAQRFQLPWPVLADQKGSTWKAYDSQGWPDRFLIDPQGKIVMSVFGEGNNVLMEKKIQELLAVAHPEVLRIPLESGADEFRHECGVATQETYIGERYGRSGVLDMNGHHTGEEADFMPPHSPPDGGVMLVGRWHVDQDGVTAQGAGRRRGNPISRTLAVCGVEPGWGEAGEGLPLPGWRALAEGWSRLGREVRRQGSVRRRDPGQDVLPGAQPKVQRAFVVTESGCSGIDAAFVYVWKRLPVGRSAMTKAGCEPHAPVFLWLSS